MNSQNTYSDTNSSASVFLYGAILFANMDYSGLADYAIKALLGGVIWLAFKLTADFLSNKMRKRK